MARSPATSAKKARVTEDGLHKAVAGYLRAAWPAGLTWYHTANEGYRDPRTAAGLKNKGVLAGVPDLTLHLPRGQVGYIELKRPGGTLSEPQIAFRDSCHGSGQAYAIAQTPEEVEAICIRWLAAFDLSPRATMIRKAA